MAAMFSGQVRFSANAWELKLKEVVKRTRAIAAIASKFLKFGIIDRFLMIGFIKHF
jgi:hypothetical protein